MIHGAQLHAALKAAYDELPQVRPLDSSQFQLVLRVINDCANKLKVDDPIDSVESICVVVDSDDITK